MRRFKNLLIFQICPSSSGDIWLLVLQKRIFLDKTWGNLQLHIWNDAKRKIFDVFIFIWKFLGINTPNIKKMIQNLKIRTCFMQNFVELDMKKTTLDPAAVTLGVWA